LNAKQVAEDLFHGQVGEAWVRRNLDHLKVTLGHSTVCFYEYDVLAWIDKQRLEVEAT